MNNLGVCYERGTGVKVNLEMAFDWYMKAADKGDMQSQVNVANAYYLGNGIEMDHHKAFLWYREAAFQGHILSQKNVGAAYWNHQLHTVAAACCYDLQNHHHALADAEACAAIALYLL